MTRDDCIAAAGLVLAEARAERADIYARGGAGAVAEWAHVPGGPPKDELAARYERWVQEDRAASEAA